MIRNKMVAGMVAIVASWALCVPMAGGAIYFDGGGDPADAGFELFFVTDTSGWQFDTESGSPQPGVLYQNVATGFYSSYRLDPTAAATELVRANGWFAEFRVQVLANGGGLEEAFNVFIQTADDQGAVYAILHPDRYYFYDANTFANALQVTGLATDAYHTVRLTMAPGGATVAVAVDGISLGNAPMLATTTPALRFGDGDGDPSGPGRANWDYVVLNTEIPEPASLVLMGTGALLMLRRRQGSR